MKNNKGFTLVELLVAATILGILAVFATTAYRNSVAESRWTQSRAMANQLASSLQRVKMDYPSIKMEANVMRNPEGMGACPFNYGTGAFPEIFNVEDLVNCGYMEVGAWTNEYIEYLVCGTEPSQEICKKQLDSAYPLVCARVKENAKLPAQFLTNTYCVYETGAAEESRTENGTEACIPL